MCRGRIYFCPIDKYEINPFGADMESAPTFIIRCEPRLMGFYMKALILAAGYGTRLMPYTQSIPKPLFPLGGKPVLEICIEKLIHAGCKKILINTHHLHEQVENFVRTRQFSIPVKTVHEPDILGTGGAVMNVRKLMEDNPFIVINSDIVSSLNLKKLWELHLGGSWPVTLALHDSSRFNKISISKDHFVTDFLTMTSEGQISQKLNSSHIDSFSQNNTFSQDNIPDLQPLFAFTGIQVLSSEIFKHMPKTKNFSSIDVYKSLAKQGDNVKAYMEDNIYWQDIGTPETYRNAVILHAAANTGAYTADNSSIHAAENSTAYTAGNSTAHAADNCTAYTAGNSTAHAADNCTAYTAGNSAAHSAELMYPAKTSDLRPDGSHLRNISLNQLAGDGSDRKWFRCRSGKATAIAADHGIHGQNMSQAAEMGSVTEMDSFVKIGSHLFSRGIPVPQIKAHDRFSGIVLLEDLGNTHLQDIVRAASSRDIKKWYEKICRLIIRFSIEGKKGFRPEWTFQTPSYSKSMILEKECRYFVDAFLNQNLKKNISFDDFICDFEFIADNALKDGFYGLMHRDMQSRNIMIRDGDAFFIDFQSARMGPVQYDLASLLIDPYVNLEEDTREYLLAFCARELSTCTGFPQERFIRGYRYCAITRNLQILGAFSHLSLNRGKTSFKNYIPEALKTLKTNLTRINTQKTDKLYSYIRKIKYDG